MPCFTLIVIPEANQNCSKVTTPPELAGKGQTPHNETARLRVNWLLSGDYTRKR